MKRKKLMSILLVSALAAGMVSGCGNDKKEEPAENPENRKPYEGVELSMLVDNATGKEGYEAVLDLAEEELGMKVKVEVGLSGTEQQNLMKTRLAAGEAPDIIYYNTGSLLSSVNPEQYFIDLTDSDVSSSLDDGFVEAASVDGKLYGVPYQSSNVGGVFYNKTIYEELDLDVPETWDDFIANCDKIKESGQTAVIGSFGDVWTTQLPFLADNYAMIYENPDFPKQFTEGTAKFAATEAGVRSFEKLAALTPYYNEDYLACTYNDACDMLANGEGTHYFIQSNCLNTISSLYGQETANGIGFFATPGDTAEETGATVWCSNALYGNKNSENVDAVKALLEWWISDQAITAFVKAVPAVGPYHNGYQLPDETFTAVKEEMQKYFDEGKTAPALEFLTPVKGINCESLCQELGSGQSTPEETAQAYDEDCRKQAVQLGLKWD